MRSVGFAKAYELIDCGGFERYEKWVDCDTCAEYFLIRPDPVAVWERGFDWHNSRVDGRYIRSDKGGGEWQYYRAIPESWVSVFDNLKFIVRPSGFKHTWVFPEQAVNWRYAADTLAHAARTDIKVLNLFAYTGIATLACAAVPNVSVTHLDAVKSIVDWAKQNAALNGINNVRWIVDDAVKFLEREVRRGSRYEAVILDPPSYGRGTNGEMWHLKSSLNHLLTLVRDVLSETPLFVLLNGYTTGISPAATEYLCRTVFDNAADIHVSEIGIPVTSTQMTLPCGNTAIISFT